MISRKLIKHTGLAASMALLMSGTAHAYNYDVPSLYEQTDGNVTYVTGGIGDGERDALEAAKSEYSLQLWNTTKTGAFVSNTSVEIQDSKGTSLMAIKAGPILYVKLPAGRYKILAENSGIIQNKWVRVGKSATVAQLYWNVEE